MTKRLLIVSGALLASALLPTVGRAASAASAEAASAAAPAALSAEASDPVAASLDMADPDQERNGTRTPVLYRFNAEKYQEMKQRGFRLEF